MTKGPMRGERRLEHTKRRLQLLNLEGDVRRKARERGFRLKTSVMTSGKLKTETLHWMFDREEGGRVLDYWPVKGTWRCPINGERGNTSDPFEALEIACKLSCQPPEQRDTAPLVIQPTLF